MKCLFVLLVLILSCPVLAVSSDLDPKISKLEFQGIHFGDFPSVDMICVRGLCPVGALGVGINTNSRIPPRYIKEMAITHYNRVQISTPEYSYIDDKMFQVQFEIDCEWQGQAECIDAITRALDVEYGLTLIEKTEDDDATFPDGLAAYKTESGSLVVVVWPKQNMRGMRPFVKIFDETLMDMARTSLNPDYPSFVAERAKQAAQNK